MRKGCRIRYGHGASRQGERLTYPPTVFIDAPHVLVPVDFADAFRAKPGTSSLSDSGAQGTSTDTDSDPALAPRYWWNLKADPAARSKTIGVEDSILLLRDVLSKDHYDGILGFR